MNRAEFLQCEYVTLREEIKNSRANMFKLAVGSIVGVPTAYSLAAKIDVDAVVYSLPLLICTITLLYLAETMTVMRAGRYVKEYIEKNIVDAGTSPVVKGWEHWLEVYPPPHNEPHRRLTDRFLSIFFYIMFVFYYIASVILAMNKANTRFVGTSIPAILVGIYVSIGILFVAYLLYSFRRSTGTT